MAKSIMKAVKSKSKTKAKAQAIDWAEPYPPASQEILVRVQVNQDLFVSGRSYPKGVHIMNSETAHAHSAALSTPAPLTEE